MRRLVLLGALAVAGAVSLSGCGKQAGPPPKMPPQQVGVVTVTEQPVPLIAELPGRTSPFAVSEVRPQISGIVQKRLFVEGSNVKAGQVLYQIDPAPYQAAYDSAAATVNSTRAKADRYATLLKANAVSAQDYDDAEAAYKLAAANAQAARINLGWTRIVAPISGRIGASTVTEGALVSVGQATALATISTLDPIYVDIDQSSNELLALERQIRSGNASTNSAPVALKLDDGSAYAHPGKLQFTDVTVDAATGAVKLRALFPNPEGLLLPGLYVRATVTQGVDTHGILVPQSVVGHDAKGDPYVLTVDAQNMARLTPVKTGRAIASNWQVLSGLKAGDKIIVDGLAKVQPDMPVVPQPVTPAAAPAQK
jgi:membrane fusion protein (multidrug efflux system)